jgi:hypothetical protein
MLVPVEGIFTICIRLFGQTVHRTKAKILRFPDERPNQLPDGIFGIVGKMPPNLLHVNCLVASNARNPHKSATTNYVDGPYGKIVLWNMRDVT